MNKFNFNQIKHSGIYRFIFDKSDVTQPENTEVLRLVVGYSEKGKFNTPVFVRNEDEFKTEFGGISKKLERYGCFFHRSALQCLKNGKPILALNIKPFETETLDCLNFNINESIRNVINLKVKDIYNTDRFWYLEPEHLEEIDVINKKYVTITSTDSKESCSNTIFMRGHSPKNYDITFKEYFASVLNSELPLYLEGYENDKLCDYFAEVYVFKGEFTKDIVSSGLLSKYFKIENDKVVLRDDLTNAFGEKIDTLQALANNEVSNFVRSYTGIVLPDFQGSNGSIISLDTLFNLDYSLHKMLMRFNQSLLLDGESVTMKDLNTTGWNIENGKPFMSFDSVKNTTCIANYDSAAKKWVYVGEENATFYAYDTSRYTIDENDKTQVVCNAEFAYAGINVGDTFKGSKSTVILLKKDVLEDSKILLKFSGEVVNMIKCMNVSTEGCSNLVPSYIKGYTYSNGKPASTKQNDKLVWQHKILGVLKEKGIRAALTNRVDCEFRYLVDTFEGFVETECKSILTAICKDKFNCLGLINFPAIKNFSSCDYTSFRDSEDRFNIKYIEKGGNPQRTITRVFTLASEDNGASFVEYVTALSLRDTTTGVKTTIPSAALLSNEYMKKYDVRHPYSIVAGPNYGRVNELGLIGPDFNFGGEDLDILEPMGVNCFVYAPGKGTFVNSQQTAKQNPITALSKVHIRELCTFLQDEIEKMLQNYQWEFNTQRLRDEVKGKADVICETCKNNGGINYYKNTCDETNNTPEVLNNEFFLLDTVIIPNYGAGKMVQRLTIHNNGSVTASIVE